MDLVQRLKLLSVLSSCCSQLHIQTVVLVRPAAEGNTWNMCSDVKCACRWGRVNRAGTRHKWEICLLITISEWISAAQQNIWTWTLTTFMLIKWIRTKLEVSVQNRGWIIKHVSDTKLYVSLTCDCRCSENQNHLVTVRTAVGFCTAVHQTNRWALWSLLLVVWLIGLEGFQNQKWPDWIFKKAAAWRRSCSSSWWVL